jgi:methyltransferase-like protein/2-polyprenyl-3-methyl-5-hydroxy-6-metoxy-1,4-benzoquinol methylase
VNPQNTYDLVPYESNPFPQTHPDRFAVIGTLFGMRPLPVHRCRVLEIGCAGGGNLIPLALAYPDSTFVGIDLSQVQIAEGQGTVAALGLKNIELRHQDVSHVAPQLGVFDYVICHGIYSWVAPPVQEKILDTCNKHLAPQGIAYVSYNTYPGWHMRGMIRDMLQYHVQPFTVPAMKVRQARNLLDFLGKASAQDKGPYGLLLRNELESFRRSSDSYLFHEHLEEVNEPIYFHQFVEKAAAHALRYLGEADLRVMVPGNFPPEIENVLQMVAQDAVHLEQYMDFLRNRMFRQTLLCHNNVEPHYELKWETVRRFAVASPVRAIGPDVVAEAARVGIGSIGAAADAGSVGHGDSPMKFETPDGITLLAREPIVKAAMLELVDAWPRAVPFEELLAQARRRLEVRPAGLGDLSRGVGGSEQSTNYNDAETLGQSLLQSYAQASTSLVEFWLTQPSFTTTVSARPRTSALARHQAAGKNLVTTLRHETAHLGDFERHLVRLLDGSRDRATLMAELVELVGQGELTVEKDSRPVKLPAEVREIIERALQAQLHVLAKNALLVG